MGWNRKLRTTAGQGLVLRRTLLAMIKVKQLVRIHPLPRGIGGYYSVGMTVLTVMSKSLPTTTMGEASCSAELGE